MRDSERSIWSPAEIGIRLLILVLAAFLLMALQQTGRLDPVEGAIASITSPGQQGMAGITDRLLEAFTAIGEFRTLQQRNAELERINESMLVENLRLQEVERENQRLRELLAFAETRPGIEFRGGQIIARPIGFDSNNFLGFIMIDLGRRHGIEIGMPVINDQGLVGRVSEVTQNTSKVLLMTDPASTVNAILQSSRLAGVVNGQPGSLPVMGFIPQDGEVAVGEIVLSSGMGGNFPKGIPIGQVTEVRQRDFDVFQEAVIRPTVDFGRLEIVMVVTNFDPLEVVPELDAPPTVSPLDATPDPESSGEDSVSQESNADVAPVDAPSVDAPPEETSPEETP